MKIQINMTTSCCDLNRFSDRHEFLTLIEDFAGVELMCCEEDVRNIIPKERVIGIHTCSVPYWYDFWRGDIKSCINEFDDVGTCRSYYGGSDRDALISHFRRDLAKAAEYDVEYIVFHVSDCTIEEAITGKYKHSDEEIIDACCEMMNELMPETEVGPQLLLENLWEPGLTFLRPEMTARLLNGIRYKNKGIMLDTGHLMNTNPSLRTPEEALEYINSLLDNHNELCSRIKGIHLNQSLSGVYARHIAEHPPTMPSTYSERFGQMFEYVFKVDQHKPFVCNGVEELVKRISPDYLTFEFISNDLTEHCQLLAAQKRALPFLFGI